MVSRIDLRLANKDEIAEDLSYPAENIGILKVQYNETDISLNIQVENGYIMDTDECSGDVNSSDVMRYFWRKNKKITSVGLNEPPIDNLYYVKSKENNNSIRVIIEEESSALNSRIRRKLEVSVQKKHELPIHIYPYIGAQNVERPTLRRSARIYHESDNENRNNEMYLGTES